MFYMFLKELLLPVFLVVIPVTGSIMVAKINNMQASLKTNSGTKSPGDAIDKLLHAVEDLKKRLIDIELKLDNVDLRLDIHIDQANEKLDELQQKVEKK